MPRTHENIIYYACLIFCAGVIGLSVAKSLGYATAAQPEPTILPEPTISSQGPAKIPHLDPDTVLAMIASSDPKAQSAGCIYLMLSASADIARYDRGQWSQAEIEKDAPVLRVLNKCRHL